PVIAAPLAAITGGAGIAGLLGAVKATSDYADAMATAASIAGLGAEAFQLLNYVAEQANVPTEALSKSFNALNKNIAAARSGNGKAIEMFQAMGISLNELQTLSPDQVMKRLADGFEKIENPSLKVAAAMALLGKNGAAMLPALAGGSKAMEEGEQKAKRLGLALNDLDTNIVKDFGDNIGTLMKALEGVRNAIAVKIIPVLDPLVNRLTEWIAANRELIATKVGEFVQRFAAWIERINFDRVFSGIKSFMDGVQRLVDLIGGWGNAIAVLALSMTGLLGPLLQLGSGFLGLIGPILKIGAGLIALTGPIGIAIAVIAGLAAAAYLIIDNWSSIGPFIENLWGGIVDFLGGIVGTVTDLGGKIIGGLWSGMKTVFGTLWGWLTGAIQGVVELITWPLRAVTDLVSNVVTGGGVNPVASVQNTAPQFLGGGGIFGGSPAAAPAGSSSSSGLLPPRPQASGPAKVQGNMVVEFVNAPENMKIRSATTDTPGLTFRPDLGPAFGLA
ncbi:hypothetical protein, partial [Elstera sp.]|uniref:hypothetical protein n=1 Tax=Elstera sp. TaxID=1916664 RepID=UPI0037C0E92F